MSHRFYSRGQPLSGQQEPRRGRTRHVWVLFAALAAIVLACPTAAALTKEVRRILILNEANATYPGIVIINQGIQAGLNDSLYHLEFYSEYMDTNLFPDPAVQQEFRASYIRKYQNLKLDVIITVGPSPLRFMQEVHQKVFPGIPIGRRLIEAQEAERTWIGRELHDDINQRLALVENELAQWSQNASTNEATELVRHIRAHITEIAEDVQGLSHRLHSSKLDYLGLASAAESFCKELSENARVEIVFEHAGIPHNLSKEVSLCLFRVLQEGLQNAVKHSGVWSFVVGLQGTGESIELTVADLGNGFEEKEAFTRHGLGLISMRERLQMEHGELSVKSQPGVGTTIRARVPLKTGEYRAIAG